MYYDAKADAELVSAPTYTGGRGSCQSHAPSLSKWLQVGRECWAAELFASGF